MVIAAASARLSACRESAPLVGKRSPRHTVICHTIISSQLPYWIVDNQGRRTRSRIPAADRGAPFPSIDCRRTELIREGLRPATGRSSQMLSLLVARGLSRGDWFEFGLSRRISVACSGFAMAMPTRNRGLRPKRRGAVFLREPSRRNPQRDRYGRLLTHARLSKTQRTPAPVPKAEGRPARPLGGVESSRETLA